MSALVGYTPYVGVIAIFVTNLLNGKDPVIFGDGEQQRNFVHVDDIVAGTLASLDALPGTFNLGTGRTTSVNQLAALWRRDPALRSLPAGAGLEPVPVLLPACGGYRGVLVGGPLDRTVRTPGGGLAGLAAPREISGTGDGPGLCAAAAFPVATARENCFPGVWMQSP